MNIGILIAVLAVCIFAILAFFTLASSSKWTEASGVISHIEIKEHYAAPGTTANSVGSLTDYELVLKYNYSFNGESYTGSNIYAALPNIFSKRALAESAAEKYKEGAAVSVYVNPKNPERSALETVSALKPKALVVIAGLFLLVVSIAGGGAYFLSKI